MLNGILYYQENYHWKILISRINILIQKKKELQKKVECFRWKISKKCKRNSLQHNELVSIIFHSIESTYCALKYFYIISPFISIRWSYCNHHSMIIHNHLFSRSINHLIHMPLEIQSIMINKNLFFCSCLTNYFLLFIIYLILFILSPLYSNRC